MNISGPAQAWLAQGWQMGRGFGTAGTQEGPGRRVPSAPRPGTVSACCFLFGAGSGHLSSLTLTHLGSEWRALGGGQSLGDLQEPQRKVRSALISLSWAPREQPWAPEPWFCPMRLTRDCWCRSGPGHSHQGATGGYTRSWQSTCWHRTPRRGRAQIHSHWEEEDMAVRRQAVAGMRASPG